MDEDDMVGCNKCDNDQERVSLPCGLFQWRLSSDTGYTAMASL